MPRFYKSIERLEFLIYRNISTSFEADAILVVVTF